jgi:lysophospholipase L1-like esterase
MASVSAVKTPTPLARKLVYVSILVVLQGVVALVLLEVAARVFDPIGISYYPNTAAYMDTMILEEPIGYRNRPSLQGTYYTQPVTINSLGLRHPEIALAPDPSRYRILLMGDSVVFGVGVSDEDTISAQLQAILREKVGAIKGREIEVINMGVISYNTEQELIQYKSLGVELKPDLVLLMFSNNDIESKMWIFQKRSSWLVAMGQRSYAVSLLFKLKQDLASRLSRSQPLIQQSSYAEGHPRWENIDSSMTQLNQLARSEGIPFIVFARTDSDAPWDLLGRVAQREGFPLRSLRPFQDERWKDRDRREVLAKGGGLHANREGLAMFTTLIYEELEDLDVWTPRRGELGRAR